VLSGIGIYVADTEITSNSGLFAVSCGYLILLISWLVNLYYLFKVVIVSSFIEEEKVENAYGLPLYNDQCHKDRAIALATFTIFFGILIWNLFSGYGALLPVVYGM
jgi:membrane-anchored glycerophosphoryl diester phosphodiesterase (GDPDase)